MSYNKEKCDMCKQVIGEDFIKTVHFVGMSETGFEICKDCLKEYNILVLDYDDLDENGELSDYNLTPEEINVFENHSRIFVIKDKKFRTELIKILDKDIKNLSCKISRLKNLKVNEDKHNV